jgi:hypothetical protein
VFGIDHAAQLGSVQAGAPARSQTVGAAHVVAAFHTVQPLLPTEQLWRVSLVGQRVDPLVHALVQHAPPLHAPLVHGVVDDSKKHPCRSWAQLASVVPLAQVVFTLAHTASALQVHAAEPAAPVHVCRVPGHAAGVPYA